MCRFIFYLSLCVSLIDCVEWSLSILRDIGEVICPQLARFEAINKIIQLDYDSDRNRDCDSSCADSLVVAEIITALREHWDEANARVLQRKAQLDAMLGDSQRYEARRRDADAWLSRMETRLAGMTPPGHTADVLEMQLREQKSFHAEVHQYKHQIELFGQLTQRLIAVYRNDDTTRIKRATESINHRYNELNNSIIARGKALHSAVSSLQNFDRSLEKFVAWLSEAESLLDAAERDPHLLKRSVAKDLTLPFHLKLHLTLNHALHELPFCNADSLIVGLL
ncbi:unnamed protein product, partial [Brenthis ino]